MKKKLEDMNLDEVISVAYSHAQELDRTLNRILSLRSKQQLTKPRIAELLHRSLKDLAVTATKLSTTDYEKDLADETKKIEEHNRWVDEMNVKWHTPKKK